MYELISPPLCSRYMEGNKAATRQRREEARKLKEELTVLHAKLEK